MRLHHPSGCGHRPTPPSLTYVRKRVTVERAAVDRVTAGGARKETAALPRGVAYPAAAVAAPVAGRSRQEARALPGGLAGPTAAGGTICACGAGGEAGAVPRRIAGPAAAVRSGRARRSGGYTAPPGTAREGAALIEVGAGGACWQARAVPGGVAQPIAAVLVCGAATALEPTAGPFAEAEAVGRVEMTGRAAERAVAAAGAAPRTTTRRRRGACTHGARIGAFFVRPARAVAVTGTRVGRVGQGSRGRGRAGGGGGPAGIWCADPTQQEKTAGREALGETHDGALVEGSTRCALRAARRGWCRRGGRDRAIREPRLHRTGAGPRLALFEEQRLAGLEGRARQARASGGDLLRARLRAANRRRRFGAGDKDAHPERNSSQRDDCPPNHRRAPLWPFPCNDRFRRF
jgi:hypothetical protein